MSLFCFCYRGENTEDNKTIEQLGGGQKWMLKTIEGTLLPKMV